MTDQERYQRGLDQAKTLRIQEEIKKQRETAAKEDKKINKKKRKKGK
jgi:hypothetical protein